MRRRQFLDLSLATIGLLPFAQQARPDASPLLRSGPMLGYSEMTEVVVWLQTTRPCRAQIRFWPRGRPEDARLTETIDTSAAGDHIARFTIGRLAFGTKYDYEVYLDGIRVARPYPLTFQSQAMWQWRSAPPEVRFAIGSCSYVNDPDYDRPGDPYGDKMEIFQAIAARRPDAMIWLGDNVYYREGDWGSESGMRYRFAHTRSLPEMQALLASTHQYAIWDDHDFGPNDSDASYRMRDRSLRIFKDYWANPGYGTGDTPGVFGRFEWADVEFFLLDDRYHRTPNAMPDAPDKVMFGAAQMRWLMESLRSSLATFKIVAGGNQILNTISTHEAWAKYPAEHGRFMSFLRETKIPGVLFLSGDRHHTELIRWTEPGLYPLYDFTSSALTSGGGRNKAEENNPLRVPGTWVTETRNFGLIEVSGPRTARTMTLKAVDWSGKDLWSHTIAAAELRVASAVPD
jgi:alkaline phosphatase D